MKCQVLVYYSIVFHIIKESVHRVVKIDASSVPCCCCVVSCALAANDLKLIVGSDLGDEGIKRIFKEFDLNDDGEIDFE